MSTTNSTQAATMGGASTTTIGSESPVFEHDFWERYHRNVDTKIVNDLKDERGTTVVNGVVCIDSKQERSND